MSETQKILSSVALLSLAGLFVAGCSRSEPGASSDMRGSTNVSTNPAPPSAVDSVTGPDVTQPAVTVSADSAHLHKYDVRSGIVRYRNSYLDREQIFYFDDYGAREALYDVLPEGRKSTEEDPYVAIIHADGKRRMFDLQNRTGRMSELNPEPGAILGTIPDVWNKISIVKKAQQAEELPPRDVLGRPTTGYEFQVPGNAGFYKVWIWNRIPLYSEIRMDEEPLHLEAISVEIDVPIPADRFTPPSNIIFALE